MGSATTPTPEIAVTSVKIERRKLEALREVATAEQRSVSAQIRWLIDRCIEDHPPAPEEIAA